MSDAPGLTTDTAPTQVPGSGAPASASPPSGAAPPDGSDPLGELPADRAVFDRGYVDSVRREAQRYRNEAQTAAASAKTYDDVFGVYEPADREVWFDLARAWATDPAQAAAVMQQIAGSVLGGAPGPGTPEQPDDPALEPDSQLSEAQVQRLIEQQLSARDAKAMESRAIDEIYTEVRAGGIDPESAEGIMVLWNANHLTNGDIKAALAKHNEYRQGIIDGYVKGRTNGSVPMPAASGGVGAIPTDEPIKTIKDARKATEAWLRERRSPG
jgi:hypothetical protein